MPLLDHFRLPLKGRRHWEGFHARWSGAIADALNEVELPKRYVAEARVTRGAHLDVDAAVAPPVPQLEMPAIFPDAIEVLVFSEEDELRLVGAIELVSPRNKDRPLARRAFANKCLAYLQQGVGVVAVDIVTTRRANLHDEIAQVIGRGAPRFPAKTATYAVAYRPYRQKDDERIAIWPETLALGQALPTMPLWLTGLGTPVRVDLEGTYSEAQQRTRIDEVLN